jgi:hypothetical protein
MFDAYSPSKHSTNPTSKNYFIQTWTKTWTPYHLNCKVFENRIIIIQDDVYLSPFDFTQLLEVESKTMNIIMQQLLHLAYLSSYYYVGPNFYSHVSTWIKNCP